MVIIAATTIVLINTQIASAAPFITADEGKAISAQSRTADLANLIGTNLTSTQVSSTLHRNHKPACPESNQPHTVRCYAQIITDSNGNIQFFNSTA